MKFKALLIFLLTVITLSGCQAQISGAKNNIIDWYNQTKDYLFKVAKDKALLIKEEKTVEESLIEKELILDEEEKRLIDQWLADNNLNQFGDPLDTEYPNDNPLENPETGEVINRYQYILQNHPDLIQELNLN